MRCICTTAVPATYGAAKNVLLRGVKVVDSGNPSGTPNRVLYTGSP